MCAGEGRPGGREGGREWGKRACQFTREREMPTLFKPNIFSVLVRHSSVKYIPERFIQSYHVQIFPRDLRIDIFVMLCSLVKYIR